MTRRSIIQALVFAGVARATSADQGSRRVGRIVIVNNSSTPLDQAIVDAVQRQLDEHVFPIWGRSAELVVAASGDGIGSCDFSCCVLDETDVPGDMGYHSVDANARPFARVFASTIARAGEQLSAIMSHEIIEMVGDPWGNSSVLYNCDDSTGALYKLELCDPVQGNRYYIDGIQVSNFVTPQYFQKTGTAPFDYLGVLQYPFVIAPYGAQRMMLVSQLGRWT